jgi:hypothetical protein
MGTLFLYDGRWMFSILKMDSRFCSKDDFRCYSIVNGIDASRLNMEERSSLIFTRNIYLLKLTI